MKTKEEKRKEAEVRQAKYDSMSKEEKISRLQINGYVHTREYKRLRANG